jgi:hypothetical protein
VAKNAMRDELIKRVAEKLENAYYNLGCPEGVGLDSISHGLGCRGSEAECTECWATAIVNLVKGEEEK